MGPVLGSQVLERLTSERQRKGGTQQTRDESVVAAVDDAVVVDAAAVVDAVVVVVDAVVVVAVDVVAEHGCRPCPGVWRGTLLVSIL